MQFAIDLKCIGSSEWLHVALADFDSFLQDHADVNAKPPGWL